MKRLLACAVLCLLLAGCWLVEKQRVLLDPEQAAQIEASIGKLNRKNLDEWIKEASLATKSDVEGVRKTAAGIELKLSAPVEEAGLDAGITLLESVAANPTPAGIVIGLPAALFALLSVFQRRAKMRSERGVK
jgi:hypothetical protein